MKPPEAQTARAIPLHAVLITDAPRIRRFRPYSPLALRLLGDDRLARLASEGDRAAFAAIFDRYHHALYRYCLTILRDAEDAADAVQTTMLNALRSLHGDRREIALRPWLYRIAFNESIALLRRRPTSTLGDLPVPARLDVEADLELRERFDELLADMQELPERQRGALAMRELAGLEYDDIAAALATSPGAAKQAIYEARRTLHELARGREMDCEVIRDALAGDGRSLRGRAVRAHLRACSDCRELRATVDHRRSRLAAFAPAMPAFTARRIVQGLGLAGGGGLAAEGGFVTAGLPAALKAFTVLLAGVVVSTGGGAGNAAVGGASAAGARAHVAAPRAERSIAAPAGKRTEHARATHSHASSAGSARSHRGPAAHGHTTRSGNGPRHVAHLRTDPATAGTATAADPQPGAQSAPAPASAPAGSPRRTRPQPVRSTIVPPRDSSDPGPVQTAVQSVQETTTATVVHVQQAVPQVHLPALPKRQQARR